MMTLSEAMRIVREADPAEKMRIEMWEATKDVDFAAEVRRGVPGPSMAGLDPRHADVIAARSARSPSRPPATSGGRPIAQLPATSRSSSSAPARRPRRSRW